MSRISRYALPGGLALLLADVSYLHAMPDCWARRVLVDAEASLDGMSAPVLLLLTDEGGAEYLDGDGFLEVVILPVSGPRGPGPRVLWRSRRPEGVGAISCFLGGDPWEALRALGAADDVLSS